MKNLSEIQKNFLNQASPEGVESAFNGFIENIDCQSWISINNYYHNNCINKIKDELDAWQMVYYKRHFADYIAASGPLHCIDGWSFLGRSLDCHSRGDYSTSIHLAYYAELRAAISLLATQGIGIFDNHHFIIDQAGDCICLPGDGRTHSITWAILQFWANQPKSTQLLLNTIHPCNIPLGEWLNAFSGSQQKTNEEILCSDLLEHWGLDLKTLSEDHNIRNEVSYRPTQLSNSYNSRYWDNLQFLFNFWEMYEPQGEHRFNNIDQHLMKFTLMKYFDSMTDKKSSPNFNDKIQQMLDNMAIDSNTHNLLRPFLSQEHQIFKNNIILEASKTDHFGYQNQHLQVISRAALLLRVATGSSANLLNRSRFNHETVNTWMNFFGVNRGLWSEGNEPEQIIDLWTDIEDAINDARQFEIEHVNGHESLHQLLISNPDAFSRLGECERIALWGLGF
jgi:hypothetical protein